MALFQSSYGKRLLTPTRPLSAGAVHCARFEYAFTSAFAFATDKLELGVLPAFARPVDAVLLGGLTAAGNATVGLMSGDVGNPDNARTVGSEFFSATDALDTVTRMSLATGFNLDPAEVDRSIGVTLSANVAAGGGRKIALLLFYTM